MFRFIYFYTVYSAYICTHISCLLCSDSHEGQNTQLGSTLAQSSGKLDVESEDELPVAADSENELEGEPVAADSEDELEGEQEELKSSPEQSDREDAEDADQVQFLAAPPPPDSDEPHTLSVLPQPQQQQEQQDQQQQQHTQQLYEGFEGISKVTLNGGEERWKLEVTGEIYLHYDKAYSASLRHQRWVSYKYIHIYTVYII